MGMSLGDLAGAGVGGDDGTEVGRQPGPEGCLPVAVGVVRELAEKAHACHHPIGIAALCDSFN